MEFVVIVGVVFIALAVIFYAYQSNIFVPPLTPQTADIKNTVTNFIREGADSVLRLMYEHGGYTDVASDYVTYLGKSVPYWQRNGQVSYPNVQQNFVQGLAQYINNNKDALQDALNSSNVTFGNAEVFANLLSNQISITVNMPTTVKGTPLPQPYVVAFPSKLGEIYEFSKNFAVQDATTRYLEYFTLSSMLITPFEGDVQTVPFFVFLTRCGSFVFKTWWDIKPHAEAAIATTLAHTYMPGKSPLNVMTTTSYPKYMIPDLLGNRYSKLDITFQLPDNFELTRPNFYVSPEPITDMAQPVPFVGVCQSLKPTYVKYALQYPAIVSAKDEITGYSFRFAVDVAIYDNAPRPWASNTTGYTPELQQQICENPQCIGKIKVAGSDGSPIAGAELTFMGCPLGRTGSNGLLEGYVPCGIGPLKIYKDRYGITQVQHSSDELNDTTVTIRKIPFVNLNFYRVDVVNDTLTGRFVIWPAGVQRFNEGTDENESVYMYFFNRDTAGYLDMVYTTTQATMRLLPPASYAITALLTSSDMMESRGAFNTFFNITEDMDGRDLYVYVPYSYGFKDIKNDTESAKAASILTAVLYSCGLGPISLEQHDTNNLPCIKTYSEVII
jgi:hypothetical protein